MHSLRDLSEVELIVMLNRNSEEAFLEIYRRNKDKIAGHLLRLLKSPALVEEVLQEVFLVLWEKRQALNKEQNLSGYLYRVAVNKSKNIFRRLAYDKRMRADFLENIYGPAENPIEAWLEDKDTKRVLDALLDTLPPQQRKVFILCKLEGLSYKEVSEQLQISETTVNSHIRNANKSLRLEIRRVPGLSALLTITLLFLFLI